MFLVTIDFKHTYIKSGVMRVVFKNEIKSCEISNQMFFNASFSFSKTKGKLVMKYALQNKTI